MRLLGRVIGLPKILRSTPGIDRACSMPSKWNCVEFSVANRTWLAPCLSNEISGIGNSSTARACRSNSERFCVNMVTMPVS